MARLTGQYGDPGGSGYRFLTPIHGDWWSGARLTIIIIALNFIVWFILLVASKFYPETYSFAGHYLAIHPEETFKKFYLWTLVTHGFTHFDFMHLFFNMFFLFFFAPQIERDFGRRKFLLFYLIVLTGGALVSILAKTIWSIRGIIVPGTVGASGAVMGILVAYGMSYPNQTVYIFGMFPLKVKTLVIAIVIMQLALAFQYSGGGSCTDYWGHIGGLATGFIYMKLPNLSGRGPRPPAKKPRKWRSDDDDQERSYYLEV